MLLDIITTILGIGGNALEKRQKLKEIELEGKTKIAVAQAEAEVARLNKSIDAEIDWDREAASQMEHSWKDEYLTLLLSLPMILAFFGEWGRRVVSDGFVAISLAPDWYKVSFLAAIAASFGIRALVNKFGLGQK
ncbi:hypothetical protein [Novosphingobium clariflavum]|uniref:Holin of 3TMs, for gene-transfer release n=1 Tax=Novosphingobium clariflavum TaxID=2029884 RepID=A0ABV6SBU5_9SPHN|nr:hypothetical protein [Novosphingobium clariflavum]